MARSFVSMGATILDIVGYQIDSIPEQAARFGAATAAQLASAVGSDGAVGSYTDTLAIMNAGTMPTEETTP
ncbi:hypothetical protein A3709_00080 [Halioglobus sp. HI00S01]|uniref:hypothetical protein n=1 Tax=Halioglobus sp. HI00S01 TaxID=1822214 RepID=UPI0007C2CE18|nr:hypothetical protein [Halioglobus sp. HI00S01]KZX60512.1 hypothetical protein A3709_00080 [Halioglobus sp. HI00S01]